MYEGLQGLVDGGDRLQPASWDSVGGILHLGGTAIGTARSDRFRTREGRLQAAENLVRTGIDSLVVIGGDGSLTGADTLRQEWGSLVEELVAAGRLEEIDVPADFRRNGWLAKLELGDLESVKKAKEINIPILAAMVDDGWDIVTPIPSCTLMFKQELPLMFPDDPDVIKVRDAMYDPFEYLMLRNKDNKLNTGFKKPLGKVAYHVACHQRVQRIGMKTREALQLVPGTEVTAIERCSGHDGTYTFKSEHHDTAMKICRPVVNKVKQGDVDYYSSDCAMAGHHIEAGLADGSKPASEVSRALDTDPRAYVWVLAALGGMGVLPGGTSPELYSMRSRGIERASSTSRSSRNSSLLANPCRTCIGER